MYTGTRPGVSPRHQGGEGVAGTPGACSQVFCHPIRCMRSAFISTETCSSHEARTTTTTTTTVDYYEDGEMTIASSLRTLRKQNLFWRHAQCHSSGKRVVWPSCGRCSYLCRQIWMSTCKKSKTWSVKRLRSFVCWLQFCLPRNRKLSKTFKPLSRRSVAGEAGNSLHLCVISWNVAGIPLDHLDVWLQQVSDHFPWDLTCFARRFQASQRY